MRRKLLHILGGYLSDDIKADEILNYVKSEIEVLKSKTDCLEDEDLLGEFINNKLLVKK